MAKSKIDPTTTPTDGARLLVSRNGEPTIAYIALCDEGVNYTVDGGTRRYPTSGLVYSTRHRAWQRDKNADQTPAQPRASESKAPTATKTSKAGSTLELVFDLERPTKNALRFKERVAPGGEAVMGTVYVQKSALPENVKQIKVQVTHG